MNVKENVASQNTWHRQIFFNAGMKKLTPLAKMIRDARKAMGMTQADAAAAMGMERATLAKIETGTMPGRSNLAALAKFYSIPMDVLDSGTIETAPQGREFAKDESEIGLLLFWRSLNDVQRDHFAMLLGANHLTAGFKGSGGAGKLNPEIARVKHPRRG